MVPQNINLAILSSIQTSEFYDKTIKIAGWGKNEENFISMRLRTVDLRVMNMNDCRCTLSRLSRTSIKMHQRYICSNANPHAVMNVVSNYCFNC
jgi:hypothetical protein